MVQSTTLRMVHPRFTPLIVCILLGKVSAQGIVKFQILDFCPSCQSTNTSTSKKRSHRENGQKVDLGGKCLVCTSKDVGTGYFGPLTVHYHTEIIWWIAIFGNLISKMAGCRGIRGVIWALRTLVKLILSTFDLAAFNVILGHLMPLSQNGCNSKNKNKTLGRRAKWSAIWDWRIPLHQ